MKTNRNKKRRIKTRTLKIKPKGAAPPEAEPPAYLMHVWYERSSPEDLKNLDRSVALSDSAHSWPRIQVLDNDDFKLAHKNKYGQDYVPPASPAYSRP